jgi:hypothetical protein
VFERGRALATSVFGGFRSVQRGDAEIDFENREADLVRHLREDACRNDVGNFGRTFVLTNGLFKKPSICGYYSLAMGALTKDSNFPKDRQVGLLYDKVPVAFLTHFARDDRAAKGVGELLLQDVCRRVLHAAKEVGCFGIALWALNKNPKLVSYYASYDFISLPAKNPSQLMLLPLSVIRASMPG